MTRRISKLSFVLIAAVLLLAMLPMSALAAQSGDYTYTVSNGKATITGYTGSGGAITIPSKLGGYPVTGIGEEAFYDCDTLTSVTIPMGVSSIGVSVFSRCDRLASVTIPDSVTSISAGMFALCTNLLDVTIPDSVTTIGDSAFAGCWGGLKSMTIPASVTSIGEGAFSGCDLLGYAIFKGNAPKMGEDVFAWALPGFTVYYPKGKTGYSNPWYGYPTAAYILPSAPSVKAASASYTSVKLSWGAVAGATMYEVYRAASSKGPWTKLAETAYTSRADTGLTTGTAYYYKVKAYGTVITTKVYGNDSAVASARPTPAAPTVKAASASYTRVKLTWGAVAGASGYVVYRSTSSNGTYTLAAVLTSGSTASYTNAGLATGKSYCYKVRAYRTVGAAKVYGDYSTVASARPVPAAPASVKAASASYNSVRLTWGAVAGASGYVVYRATSSNGTYALVTVISSGTTAGYTNAGLITGTTYYYKLRAYRTVGATKVYGDYSAVASARPVPAVPTGVKAARASATSIRLTWGAVTGASGYVVYRAASSTGAYTLAAVFPSGSTAIYTNTGLTTGKTYYYKVRAYRTVGTTKVYGGYSAVVSAKP